MQVDLCEHVVIPTSTPPSKLVVTPRGPLFAGGVTISTLEGEDMKKDEEASRLLADTGEIRGMTSTANGEVFIVTMGKFLRRDAAGSWHEHELTDLGFTLVVGSASPKGKVPLVTSKAITLIGPDGDVRRQTLDLPGDLSDITAVAVDGIGSGSAPRSGSSSSDPTASSCSSGRAARSRRPRRRS